MNRGEIVRIHYLALLGWVILAGPAIANDAPASDESIRQLLAITGESFTQDELDGITAFYKTTAGQALIKKTPVVMQNVMAEVQGLMRPSLEKIQQIQKETQHELNDLPAKPQ